MSTPLMTQYARMKAKYPDTILLFRLGDFYETFEEDAKVTSKVLGITLTKRGNGTARETPLAGFPYHALDSYMPKLLRAGYRVAVCEQLEDPKFAKGLVKRDVTEVVTPGVAFSDTVLDRKQNNFLLAVSLPHSRPTGEENVGIAFIDVTTAEFRAGEFPLRQLAHTISSLQPSEILIQKRDAGSVADTLRSAYGGLYTKLDDWIFNVDYARDLLINHFGTHTLKGFGIEDMTLGAVSAGAVMNYLQEAQKSNIRHIRKIAPYDAGDYILLDESTKRNLEITGSMDGRPHGTLFWVLDRTRTPMGARMLKRWISFPLRNLEPIRERLDAVEELINDPARRKKIVDTLSTIGDIERLISKICTNRANPREVFSMAGMLTAVGALAADLAGASSEVLSSLTSEMQPLPAVAQKITSALRPDPPLSLSDGNVFHRGYNRELDDLRDIALNGKSWIADLQRTEREKTGIPSLKVGFNNVFGYYIEITNTHKDRVPENYTRRQTMTGAERYITPELKDFEEKILHAEEKILELETRLFNELRGEIAGHADAIQQDARLVGTLDCLASLSDAAVTNGYTKPDMNDGRRIEIIAGRHPVIERLLPPGETYTPNDVVLDNDDNQIMIITGPNMSGKSSYLRQAGLIALLGHIGSFVPAERAVIGIIDRLYTRVGASDNIASGESTFLVEMHEAANIINTATDRSLILLDEIGRGTSTFDGISIAWALTEYIHNRLGAKTLFATHYHELNELADILPRIKNLKVEVREYGDKVIFLHRVTPGFADHSYGIQVAQMAGLPDEVTERARRILRNLEGSDLTVHGKASRKPKGRIHPEEPQMTLFELKDDALRDELKKIDIETMTPLEALERLAHLKKDC